MVDNIEMVKLFFVEHPIRFHKVERIAEYLELSIVELNEYLEELCSEEYIIVDLNHKLYRMNHNAIDHIKCKKYNDKSECANFSASGESKACSPCPFRFRNECL